MAVGWALKAALIETTRSTRSGKCAAAVKLCIPPSDDPTQACTQEMPRWSSRRKFALTMSVTVISGKVVPYGFPVCGLVLDGPLHVESEVCV